MAPDGEFTNPADTEIVINYHLKNFPLTIKDDAQNIYFVTDSCKLIIQKNPILISLYNSKNKFVFKETQPLTFGSKTTQYLSRGDDEYFYGCGMQNGYFSHRNHVMKIEKGGGWDDGGRANPSPFFMSTNGMALYAIHSISVCMISLPT